MWWYFQSTGSWTLCVRALRQWRSRSYLLAAELVPQSAKSSERGLDRDLAAERLGRRDRQRAARRRLGVGRLQPDLVERAAAASASSASAARTRVASAAVAVQHMRVLDGARRARRAPPRSTAAPSRAGRRGRRERPAGDADLDRRVHELRPRAELLRHLVARA